MLQHPCIQTAPDVILYDFACSLSEYCRNRESGYFQNTRFYHNKFHGFSHKCTIAFSCGKLRGLKTVLVSGSNLRVLHKILKLQRS